ncbi:MAG: hypothetical protein ACREMP_00460 [Candidatus Tyrphobacter sp.]
MGALKASSFRREVRLTRYYALGLTLFAGFVLLGAVHEATHDATFDTLTVHRINVVDREGKLALVITNHDDYPPPIVNGRRLQRQGLKSENGFVFYNRLGNEQGALVWDGRRRANGFSSSNALLFDSVQTDQLVGVEDGNDNGKATAGLIGWNEAPLTNAFLDLIEQYQRLTTPATRRAFASAHPELRNSFLMRFFVGYGEDNTAQVVLADDRARPRIKMFVAADGTARLQFLDARGSVTAQYPPTP